MSLDLTFLATAAPFSRGRRPHLFVTALCLLLALCLRPSPAGAAPGDVGFQGASLMRISGSAPTGSKPESKLWFNDGSWWATMFDDATAANFIHRLDRPTKTWINTGVRADPRKSSRADTLWDGEHLYVASHLFVNTSAPGDGGQLYRYSYDRARATYTLDGGFPAAINAVATETLVIDKDSSGRMWAVWVQAGRVWVSATMGDDTTWGTPFALPVDAADTLTSDDIASIVAFDDNRVGVFWGNQSTTEPGYYFAVHDDRDPVDTWGATASVLPGATVGNDHINVKAAADGHVFAGIKANTTNDADPGIILLKRSPTTNTWSRHTFSVRRERHTRPILMLDESNRQVHMLAGWPEKGGAIYLKSTSMDAPSFAPGRGTVFIDEAAGDDINDATGSKQAVTIASGMPILASDDTTNHYWYNDLLFGLTAGFSASPSSGVAPLSVQFTDQSAGGATSWLWEFGDGSTSSQQHPSHTFTTEGSYTVTLTVADAAGASTTLTRAAAVTVQTPPPPPGPTVTFLPDQDGFVNSLFPDNRYGAVVTLRARTGGPGKTNYNSYLTFTVTGLAGAPGAATLRLFTADASTTGGTLHSVAGAWTEPAITWNTAPAIDAGSIVALPRPALGAWSEVALPASLFAAGDGTYRLAIKSTSPDDVYYDSREGANPPQLVLAP